MQHQGQQILEQLNSVETPKILSSDQLVSDKIIQFNTQLFSEQDRIQDEQNQNQQTSKNQFLIKDSHQFLQKQKQKQKKLLRGSLKSTDLKKQFEKVQLDSNNSLQLQQSQISFSKKLEVTHHHHHHHANHDQQIHEEKDFPHLKDILGNIRLKQTLEKQIASIRQKLPSNVERARLKKLNPKHFEIISDFAADYDSFKTLIKNPAFLSPSLLQSQQIQEERKKNILEIQAQSEPAIYKFFTYLTKIIDIKLQQYKLPVFDPFDPDHWICIIIYILTALITIIFMFFYSVQLSFYEEDILYNEQFFYIVQVLGKLFTKNYYYYKIGFFIYAFEFFLNLNTGYYEMGKLIKKRSDIFHNYKKQCLYFDLIAFSSLIFHFFQNEDNYLCLMTTLSVVCHFVSLGFNVLDQLQTQYFNPESTWIKDQALPEGSEWYIKYIYCYFWGLTLVMTNGGIGVNTYEVTYTVFCMLLTSCLFAYVINKVGQVIEDSSKITQQYQKELVVMNTYLSNKKVSTDLSARVINYLQYLHQGHQDMSNVKDVSEVLEKLPDNFKEDILADINSKNFEYFHFLNRIFDKKMFAELQNLVQEEYFMPNQFIYTTNNSKDFGIYVVVKGEVEIIYESLQKRNQNIEMISKLSQYTTTINENANSEPLQKIKSYHNKSIDYTQQLINNLQNEKDRQHYTVMQKLQVGQYFGIQSFFVGSENSRSARSTTFTTIYKISREDFLKVVVKYSEQYEKFCMIRDQLILFKYSENLNKNYKSCQYCLNSHAVNNCPLLQYCPNSFIINQKYEKSISVGDENYKKRRPPRQHLIDQQTGQRVKEFISFWITDSEKEIYKQIYEDDLDEEDFQNQAPKKYYSVTDQDKINRHIDFLSDTHIQQAIWHLLELEEDYQLSNEESQDEIGIDDQDSDNVNIQQQTTVNHQEENQELDIIQEEMDISNVLTNRHQLSTITSTQKLKEDEENNNNNNQNQNYEQIENDQQNLEEEQQDIYQKIQIHNQKKKSNTISFSQSLQINLMNDNSQSQKLILPNFKTSNNIIYEDDEESHNNALYNKNNFCFLNQDKSIDSQNDHLSLLELSYSGGDEKKQQTDMNQNQQIDNLESSNNSFKDLSMIQNQVLSLDLKNSQDSPTMLHRQAVNERSASTLSQKLQIIKHHKSPLGQDEHQNSQLNIEYQQKQLNKKQSIESKKKSSIVKKKQSIETKKKLSIEYTKKSSLEQQDIVKNSDIKNNQLEEKLSKGEIKSESSEEEEEDEKLSARQISSHNSSSSKSSFSSDNDTAKKKQTQLDINNKEKTNKDFINNQLKSPSSQPKYPNKQTELKSPYLPNSKFNETNIKSPLNTNKIIETSKPLLKEKSYIVIKSKILKIKSILKKEKQLQQELLQQQIQPQQQLYQQQQQKPYVQKNFQFNNRRHSQQIILHKNIGLDKNIINNNNLHNNSYQSNQSTKNSGISLNNTFNQNLFQKQESIKIINNNNISTTPVQNVLPVPYQNQNNLQINQNQRRKSVLQSLRKKSQFLSSQELTLQLSQLSLDSFQQSQQMIDQNQNQKAYVNEDKGKDQYQDTGINFKKLIKKLQFDSQLFQQFEKLQEFKVYFVYNNISEIMQTIDLKREKENEKYRKLQKFSSVNISKYQKKKKRITVLHNQMKIIHQKTRKNAILPINNGIDGGIQFM